MACARVLYPSRWQCILCNARLFIIAWPAFALLFNPSRGNAPHMPRPDTSYHLPAHMLPLPEGTAPSAAGSLSLNPSRNIWGRRWYNIYKLCLLSFSVLVSVLARRPPPPPTFTRNPKRKDQQPKKKNGGGGGGGGGGDAGTGGGGGGGGGGQSVSSALASVLSDPGPSTPDISDVDPAIMDVS